VATRWQTLWIELGRPRKIELPPESQTESNGLDLLASREEFLQNACPKRRCSSEKVSGFQERLANANITQQLEDRTFGIGDKRAIGVALKPRNPKERVRFFIEETPAVVGTGKMAGEPRGQRSRCPSIELQFWLLGDVVPHALPVKRRLAADVETLEVALQ
jgi:hypothetical protein